MHRPRHARNVAIRRRCGACFLDPIARRGHADPPVDGVARPTVTGNFCFPRTNSAAVNASVGAPGPAVYVMPVEARFQR